MDRTGLLNDILAGAYSIGEGREGLASPGKEVQGRLLYEDGIALAMSAFQEGQRGGDPLTIILAEVYFLTQELEFCAEEDNDTRSSLSHALARFRDALRSLEAVEDAAGYRVA